MVERLAAGRGRPTATCRRSSRSGWTPGCRGCRTAGSAPRAASADRAVGRAPRPRRRDAVRRRAWPALLGHLVGGPGRGSARTRRRRAGSRRAVSVSTRSVADGVHRRAAGVRRGDRHVDPALVVLGDVAQDAEVLDGDDGHLGVEHRRRRSSQARGRRGCCVAVTRSPPGASGRGAASRRAGSRGARCAGPRRPPPSAGGDLGHGQGRLGEHRGDAGRGRRSRSAAGSTATPASTSAGSTRRRTAPRRRATRRRAPACIRACDSSVPSPRRSTQWAAWSRW